MMYKIILNLNYIPNYLKNLIIPKIEIELQDLIKPIY